MALTNRALAQAGLAVRVRSAEAALSVCANTSVLVAATEAAFAETLEGVQRQPRSAAERAHNVEAVVNALASRLPNWVRTGATACVSQSALLTAFPAGRLERGRQPRSRRL